MKKPTWILMASLICVAVCVILIVIDMKYNSSFSWLNYAQGLTTEIAGILITVIAINTLYALDKEKEAREEEAKRLLFIDHILSALLINSIKQAKKMFRGNHNGIDDVNLDSPEYSKLKHMFEDDGIFSGGLAIYQVLYCHLEELSNFLNKIYIEYEWKYFLEFKNLLHEFIAKTVRKQDRLSAVMNLKEVMQPHGGVEDLFKYEECPPATPDSPVLTNPIVWIFNDIKELNSFAKEYANIIDTAKRKQK